MNPLSRLLLLTAALLSLLPFATAAAADEPQSPSAQTPQTEDAAYTAGTHALNDNRWSDAVAAFDQVVSAKSHRADAALYWKAYALTRLGKPDLANATCLQLHTQFEASRWNRDCAALHLTEANPSAAPGANRHAQNDYPYQNYYYYQYQTDGKDTSQKDSNAELKMLALNSLLHRDPAQAIPLLRNILTGDQPDSLKKHALFVLAQGRSPEADALMHDLVLGKMGPNLQLQGIQASGVYEGRRSGEPLAEVYRTSSDPKVKRAVISALFVAGDDQHLVDLARAEKDLELKRVIVSQLALMNGKAASDYMLELLK